MSLLSQRAIISAPMCAKLINNHESDVYSGEQMENMMEMSCCVVLLGHHHTNRLCDVGSMQVLSIFSPMTNNKSVIWFIFHTLAAAYSRYEGPCFNDYKSSHSITEPLSVFNVSSCFWQLQSIKAGTTRHSLSRSLLHHHSEVAACLKILPHCAC